MSLLTLVQDAAVKIGIDRPSSVVGNTDADVRELLSFAQEEGKWLTKRHDWQILVKEQTYLTTATETQSNYVSTDVDRFVNESLWNRSRYLQLTGPLTAQEWQSVKASTNAPVTNCYRIRGGLFLMNPVPSAGETIAFEYVSNSWCQSSGAVAQTSWAADTDTGILNETLMTMGIVVRFKMAKGLAYDEDLAKYDAFVLAEIMAEKPRKTVDMSGCGEGRKPSIGVPEGSWNL